MQTELKWKLIHEYARQGGILYCRECENAFAITSGKNYEPVLTCFTCKSKETPGTDFYERLLETLEFPFPDYNFYHRKSE